MPTVDELLARAVGLSWESCEDLLGEPIALNDPLITTTQACRLLRVERGQVERLQRQGWLERQENTQAGRRYRLTNVLELLQPMSVDAAAELIGCSPQRVTVNPAHPLLRLDAILQRGRRRRPPAADTTWPTPVADPVSVDVLLQNFRDQPTTSSGATRRPLIEPVPVEPLRLGPTVVTGEQERWVDLVEAAQMLGVGHRTAQRMAAAGQLPAVQSMHGWRVEYGKLLLVVNARRARAVRSPEPGRPVE
jgi:hypothetical protein